MATVGDVVIYRMSAEDCAPFAAEWDEDPRLAYRMTKPEPGVIYPALVLADHGGALNLRVFLDGRDAGLWATDRVEGTTEGTWALPGTVEPPEEPTTPEIPVDPEPEPPAEPGPSPTNTEES